MIPETSFGLYIVFSPRTELILGVYQTFNQALNRVAELLKTSELVERSVGDDRIRYSHSEKPGEYYDIYRSHFFYHRDLPLIRSSIGSFKDKPIFEPVIVNK